MFRLLVVEDQVEFYEDYLLRLFGRLLPMEKISVVHVPTLDSALVALREPWDFILMDYGLGAKTDFLGNEVRDGADLVSFRRAVESEPITDKKTGNVINRFAPSFILGTSSNQVGNRLMQERGADDAFLKLEVPRMAKLIEGALKRSG